MKYCESHTAPNRIVRWQGIARTAAPEGGALRRKRSKVRGCILALACATPLSAQTVPSGQSVDLNEVLIDTVGDQNWLRFRFLAPQIAREGGDIGYAQAEGDFAHLCDTVARPYVAEFELSPDIVVITLMDRAVPFGQADADATQFIEAFRLEGDTCIWEEF